MLDDGLNMKDKSLCKEIGLARQGGLGGGGGGHVLPIKYFTL